MLSQTNKIKKYIKKTLFKYVLNFFIILEIAWNVLRKPVPVSKVLIFLHLLTQRNQQWRIDKKDQGYLWLRYNISVEMIITFRTLKIHNFLPHHTCLVILMGVNNISSTAKASPVQRNQPECPNTQDTIADKGVVRGGLDELPNRKIIKIDKAFVRSIHPTKDDAAGWSTLSRRAPLPSDDATQTTAAAVLRHGLLRLWWRRWCCCVERSRAEKGANENCMK